MNWEHLKTLLWLRWALTRNQWSRNGGIGAVISTILALAAVIGGGTAFAGAFLGGQFGLGHASPNVVLGVWSALTAAFLFIWLIGLINELQRSESIDLQRLMHLPAALGQIFAINYLASHFAFSLAIFLPAMLGLALGMAISRGPTMVLLVPLALCMVLMITAWTYWLRGWLATLMSNPRRRRTVIMTIIFAFIVLGQAPNLYINVLRKGDRTSRTSASQAGGNGRQAPRIRELDKIRRLLDMEKFFPPFWLAVGAKALAEGDVKPAILGAVGSLGIAAFGLRRAYLTTLRFYQGKRGTKAAEPSKEGPRRATAAADAIKVEEASSRRVGLVEFRPPGIPEQAAAVGLATLRSMLRAPEVKMNWASSLVVILVLAAMPLRSASRLPESAKPFVLAAAMAFSVFMLVQFYANQFGFDRDGFRALVLSPADRRLLLLGKNLACLPVGTFFGALLLAIISFWLKPSPLLILAALFQLAVALLLAGCAGNLFSILTPYRIQAGSMKPTKMPALATLVMVLCHLLFPLAMLPVFAPPLIEMAWRTAGWTPFAPLNLLLSAAVAGLAALLYWRMLSPLGRLLQRRETTILAMVSADVE